MTLAAEQGLHFGRDIVFTFGPLGYALQGVPEPPLAVATALVNALLAAVAAIGMWTAVRGRGSPALRVLTVAAAVFFASNVTLDYVAAIGVAALLIRCGRDPRAAPLVGLGVGVVASIGLLSKYTLGIDALAAGTAVWLVAAIRGPRRRRRASLAGAAVGYGVTAAALAVAFGFSPAALAAYVRGAAAISNGYSAAMALPGPYMQVGVALAVAAAVLALGLIAAREGKPEAGVLVAVVTFFAWKHGFVRQDGHVLYFFGTMAVVAPLLGSVLRRGPAVAFGTVATTLAAVAFLWAQSSVLGRIPGFFDAGRIPRGVAFLLHPREIAARDAGALDAALAPDRLPPEVVARIGTSTFDVLPWETAIVRAEHLRWAPLPVFQSYVAYTPSLDRLDRDALIEHGADYALFRYLSIDDRLPFADQPATMTELLCRYSVAVPEVATRRGERYVLMRRRAGAHCERETLGHAVAPVLGVPIAVPPAGAPDAFVTASFAVRPTFFAGVRNAVWRAPALFLVVRFDDGSAIRWRVVAATLPDGVIVSASPLDTADAEPLLAGRPVRTVRSVTLDARPGSFTLDDVTFTRLRRR